CFRTVTDVFGIESKNSSSCEHSPRLAAGVFPAGRRGERTGTAVGCAGISGIAGKPRGPGVPSHARACLGGRTRRQGLHYKGFFRQGIFRTAERDPGSPCRSGKDRPPAWG